MEKDHTFSKSLSTSSEEHALLLPLTSPSAGFDRQYTVYIRRWYVLGLFVLLATSQLCFWNTWGPIADTAKAVLGWNDGDIALLTNWGCITFVLSAFFYSWMMDVKGLKWSVTLGACFLFVGTGIRCIPASTDNLKWVFHCGQILIGLGGPVMMAGPALLSATWFPPHQRTTSTAIATAASYLGPAVAYLICPAVVSEIQTNSNSSIPIDPVVKQHHLNEIHMLMYIEFGVMSALFICVLVYFPPCPPTPPSASAEKERIDFKTGVLALVKMKQFWLPALCYSISNGVFFSWQSQLVVIFKDAQDVGQATSGWIGFWVGIAGVIGAVSFGMIIDVIGGKMKPVLLVLIVCGIGFSVWFVLLCLDTIHFNLGSLYASCIAFGFCLNAMVPIYFEMTIEGVYPAKEGEKPIAEGITACFMTWLMNFVCSIPLLILMIPNTAVSWLNWTALASTAISLPLLIIYKEQYNRDKQPLNVQSEYSRLAAEI